MARNTLKMASDEKVFNMKVVRLVLGHVVGGSEVDLQRISELVAIGGSEDDAGSQAGAHLGAVEVHPPMGGVGRWWQILGLGPIDEEVGQFL